MSAKYIPYSEIAKIIDMSKHKIKEKWLCSTLFTLASVNFKNEEFFESIIQYLLDEKPTENLEIISYLTIIAYMLDLSFFSKNNLKEKMYAKIKNSKDYIKNPTLSFRLIYIANTIYKDLPIDKKWLMESQYFDYFSNEFLILLAWSFTNYHKENNNDINKEIEEFRKELNLCLDMRVDIETLRKNPYLLYCYNQILQLANAGLSNKLEEKTNIFQEFYKIIDTKVEEIEFYQGKRFSTQSLKEGVFNFLLEENLVNKKEFFTKSNIKLDFLLNVENKAINVYDDEHFITDLEGKRILKPIFQNEMEILKKEGFKVLIISSSEYLNVGVEYKGIESEKKAKKIFLKKILKTFI